MAKGQLQPVVRYLRRVLARESANRVEDAQLLERYVTQHDEAAFELLVWRHERMVLNVCRRVLHDWHEAEDAFQATFLVLVRKAGSIGKRECLASWLYKVAHRTALRASARASRRANRERQDPQASVIESPADRTDDVGWRDQIASLLGLAPDLQEEILFLPRTLKGRDPIQLRHLLPIAAIPGESRGSDGSG